RDALGFVESGRVESRFLRKAGGRELGARRQPVERAPDLVMGEHVGSIPRTIRPNGSAQYIGILTSETRPRARDFRGFGQAAGARLGSSLQSPGDPVIGLFDRLSRPLLRALDPEDAHGLAIKALRYMPVPRAPADAPELNVRAFGLNFPNPVGIAA